MSIAVNQLHSNYGTIIGQVPASNAIDGMRRRQHVENFGTVTGNVILAETVTQQHVLQPRRVRCSIPAMPV